MMSFPLDWCSIYRALTIILRLFFWWITKSGSYHFGLPTKFIRTFIVRIIAFPSCHRWLILSHLTPQTTRSCTDSSFKIRLGVLLLEICLIIHQFVKGFILELSKLCNHILPQEVQGDDVIEELDQDWSCLNVNPDLQICPFLGEVCVCTIFCRKQINGGAKFQKYYGWETEPYTCAIKGTRHGRFTSRHDQHALQK